MPDTAAPSPGRASLLQVEAARYALLRRLAFAMRHQMVVHLQPIGMVTEVMDRRLRAAEPDLAQVHESMAKIHGFSKAAVQSCLDVITWMAPDATTVALDAGTHECLTLLRSNFSFRGFALGDEIGALPMTVSRAALRNVLPACLLALTDITPTPAELLVTGEPGEDESALRITLRATEGTAGFEGDGRYRQLHWHEVEALARADNVEATREADGARLVFRT
jgi:hypothetical protein